MENFLHFGIPIIAVIFYVTYEIIKAKDDIAEEERQEKRKKQMELKQK